MKCKSTDPGTILDLLSTFYEVHTKPSCHVLHHGCFSSQNCFYLVPELSLLSYGDIVRASNARYSKCMQHCLYVINCQIFQTTGQQIQYWLTAASSYSLFYSYSVTHSWTGCSHEAVMHSLSVLWKLLHVSSDTSQSVRLMSWSCMRIPWNPFFTVIAMGLAWLSCREAVFNRRVGSLILSPFGVLKLLWTRCWTICPFTYHCTSDTLYKSV